LKLPFPGKPSLARRLILLAAVWSLVVLAVTGVMLSAQFERASLSRIDDDLAAVAESLFGDTVIDEQSVRPPIFPDERFTRTYSGRYWQIAEVGPGGELLPLHRSESLFDMKLEGPPGGVEALTEEAGVAVPYDVVGPLDQPLRAGALYARSLPGHPAPLVFMAAEDRSTVDQDIRNFAVTTAVALFLLGLFIIIGVWIQVRVGLQPIYQLRREVARVRTGRADKVERSYPVELAPLAEELNALVAHNQEVVERQRTHVGNLAHALKTPISVMLAEAASHPGDLSDVVRRQSEAMHGHVEHHLRRARAAARAHGNREQTPVEPVIDELARTLARIFADRKIDIDWDCSPDLNFQGERQDLMELVGNVMENACKWTAGKVRVRAGPTPAGKLLVTIEDDGPGLPPEGRREMLERGARLDENTPGTGLGLSIVDELARAYGGEIRLEDSRLGGLRVELTLPLAEVEP
jgi:signal transduction histidine kinase